MGLNSFGYCFWMFLDGLILQNKKSHSKSESFPQTTVRICNRRKKLWQLPSRLMFHFGWQELLGNPACHSNGRPAKKGNFAGSKVSRPERSNLNFTAIALDAWPATYRVFIWPGLQMPNIFISSVLEAPYSDWCFSIQQLAIVEGIASTCPGLCQRFSLHMGLLKKKKHPMPSWQPMFCFFPRIFTTHSLGAPNAIGSDSQGQWFMQASALNKSLRRIIRFRL